MPSNMEMPIIKVTPSSPSRDPNPPDYPEFYEDKVYLQQVSRMTSCHKRGREKHEIRNEVSNDCESLTLVIDPDASDVEGILMANNGNIIKPHANPLPSFSKASMYYNH